ncbi:hypothetical protein JMY91_21700 [Brenneria goodwinii]|uniref:Uncharacterized protein n=1 Tax=Brenneria goodwinii TaxID=1109412 RepID=A0A0G4JTU4_9GAMM|nr:hypothetical protein [Brenneria goodwinii]CPR15867.1 hypothetical protein BN1221_01760c [Brenneria goodwinii]
MLRYTQQTKRREITLGKVSIVFRDDDISAVKNILPEKEKNMLSFPR